MKWAWDVDFKGHSRSFGSRAGSGAGSGAGSRTGRQTVLPEPVWKACLAPAAAVLWGLAPHHRAGDWGGAAQWV